MTKLVMHPSRRSVLQGVGAGVTGVATGVYAPGISRAADRPFLTHGVQSGDVSLDAAVAWARADRPCRAQIEWATTESFKEVRGSVFASALPDTDCVVKVALEGLPAGQDIFYRVRLQDLTSPTIMGEAKVGRFRTAPADRRSVSSAGLVTRLDRDGASMSLAAE